MPIDYKKYPVNWKELRKQVLKRAKDKCEFCGLKNYAIGYREKDGTFTECETIGEQEDAIYNGERIITIVLTVAHLDHDETNHDVKLERLAALCQRCHLRYDVQEKKKRKKDKKAIARLF